MPTCVNNAAFKGYWILAVRRLSSLNNRSSQRFPEVNMSCFKSKALHVSKARHFRLSPT